MKISATMAIVEIYLQDYPHLRDNDDKLIASVWKNHLGNENVLNMNAIGLLELFASGKLPSPESIRRSRQKLQELNPSYRGVRYLERMAHGAKVKSEIKKL